MKNLKYTLLLLPFAFIGCTNDSTSDLLDPVVDTEITYNADVKAIIETNCISCHTQPPQNGAPMPLLTYQDVKEAVLNRGLINRISRDQGAPGMMPNGGTRLPQAQINKIINWAESGFTE